MPRSKRNTRPLDPNGKMDARGDNMGLSYGAYSDKRQLASGGPSGRKFLDYGWRDPINYVYPQLIQRHHDQCVFEVVSPSVTWVASQPEEQVNRYVSSLYQLMYSEAAQRGLSISTFVLADPLNLAFYIDRYLEAWSGLRACQALIDAIGINDTVTQIGSNLAVLAPTINGILSQVTSFPMPQKVLDAADAMTGLFWTGTSATVPILVSYAGLTDYNLLSSTDCFDWVNSCLGAITHISEPANAQAANDFSNIIRVMGFLYGARPELKPRTISTNEQDYFMQTTEAWLAITSASPPVITEMAFFPNGNATPDETNSYMVYGDPEKLRPEWLSYFRTPAYGTITTPIIPTTAHGLGVWNQVYTVGPKATDFVWYSGTTGSPAVAEREDNSVYASSTPAITALMPQNDWMNWLPAIDAMTTSNPKTEIDGRVHKGFTRYWLNESEVSDNTIELYKSWFLDSISARSRR